jgi:serine/threonine-protein kinase RsbT
MFLERIPISTETDLSMAVVAAGHIAEELGFGTALAAKISTAVSELGRNVLKYAKRGEVRFKQISADNRQGIEVQVVDSGPGIENLKEAMADHFSSSGTLGLGLPGVQRLMDHFEVQSEVGKGTRVIFRKWLG